MTRQEKNEQFLLSSFLYGGNADYIENLYARWKADPKSIDDTWAGYFGRLEDTAADVAKNSEGPSWKRADWPQSANGDLVSALDGDWGLSEITVKTGKALGKKAEAEGVPAPSPVDVLQATRDSIHAIMMIRAYRMRGHLHADLDPLKMRAPEPAPELDPATYGFTEADYGRKIYIDNYLGMEFATVPEMLEVLRRTYCSTVGVEFMHISDPEAKAWIQERMEGPDKEIKFTPEGKKAILKKLVEAEGFEKFIDVKYTGTKRFGLDGSEALIPALEQIIKRGGALGVKDIVLGMAHRGRLNVLTQVMMKPHRALFHEFKGGAFYPDDVEGSGDVKYHLGASSDRTFDGQEVHLSLTANPSHLEIVDPVVLGKARAKQDQRSAVDGKFIADARHTDRSVVLPLLLHGDAAFAGQGVIAECLGLSGLKGHRTGGSIHFVINNQIGFTTAPMYSRSSPYPTDVAKMIEAPVFH
ncbi:MAG: 2-oxoglutarate dehydrogenase E1 component, partial [Hyphomicrobiales bacterium]